jgi:hypothetical protein
LLITGEDVDSSSGFTACHPQLCGSRPDLEAVASAVADGEVGAAWWRFDCLRRVVCEHESNSYLFIVALGS